MPTDAFLPSKAVGQCTLADPFPPLTQFALQLPIPCYNVFEQGKGTSKTHFCVTCFLPHTGLQLTPDAGKWGVATGMRDALQCHW